MGRINFVVEPQGGVYREYPHRVRVYSDDGKVIWEDDFPKGATIEQLMNCYRDFIEEKGE